VRPPDATHRSGIQPRIEGEFRLTAETTSIVRGNLIPTAGAFVELGAMVAGGLADSAAVSDKSDGEQRDRVA